MDLPKLFRWVQLRPKGLATYDKGDVARGGVPKCRVCVCSSVRAMVLFQGKRTTCGAKPSPGCRYCSPEGSAEEGCVGDSAASDQSPSCTTAPSCEVMIFPSPCKLYPHPHYCRRELVYPPKLRYYFPLMLVRSTIDRSPDVDVWQLSPLWRMQAMARIDAASSSRFRARKPSCK